MKVYVNYNDGRWRKYKIDFARIANAAAIKCAPGAEVSIILTNDDEIHALNREYRHIDRPTNVLSFELGESGYKALKAALDGSVATGGSRILVYATSNRRHLMPEPASDNLTSKLDENGDLHPGEVLEEKLSLAERFGVWLSFYPFTQAEYLQVLDRAFEVYPVPEAVRTSEELRLEALQWAIERGGRSGRVAMQFAKLVSAREALKG